MLYADGFVGRGEPAKWTGLILMKKFLIMVGKR